MATEQTTSPASQTHAGSARTTSNETARARRAAAVELANPTSAEPADEVCGLGVFRGDPDLRGCTRDFSDHGVADGVAACRLRERSGIRIRDTFEIVLSSDVRSRLLAHGGPRRAVPEQQLEGGRQ